MIQLQRSHGSLLTSSWYPFEYCDVALLCVRKVHGLFSSSVPSKEMDKQKSKQAQDCSECNWQQKHPAANYTNHGMLTIQYILYWIVSNGGTRFSMCYVSQNLYTLHWKNINTESGTLILTLHCFSLCFTLNFTHFTDYWWCQSVNREHQGWQGFLWHQLFPLFHNTNDLISFVLNVTGVRLVICIHDNVCFSGLG